jgi:hypothetical protein
MSPPDRKRMRRNSGSAAASPFGVQPETPHQQTLHQSSLPFNQAMAVHTQNQNMAQASLQAQQHAQQMMQAHMAQTQQSQPPTPQSVSGQNDEQVSVWTFRLPRRIGLTNMKTHQSEHASVSAPCAGATVGRHESHQVERPLFSEQPKQWIATTASHT